MHAPYGLSIIDNCLACPVREEHIFCNLSIPTVERLNQITAPALIPRGQFSSSKGSNRVEYLYCARGR
jgi:hypothetical protein